jgi:hypothetical protein
MLYPAVSARVRLVGQNGSTPNAWEIVLGYGEYVSRDFKAIRPESEESAWDYDYFPLKMDVYHVNEGVSKLKVTLWPHISPARLAHHHCSDTSAPWNNVEVGLKNFQQVNNGPGKQASPDFLADDTVQDLAATVVSHVEGVAKGIEDYGKTLFRLAGGETGGA